VKLFLSYDSAERALAETLTERLQAAGHEVFFDREDLLVGDAFDARIAASIAASDALIFLATRTALAPGAYALSELAAAERQWPQPAERLIGVVLDGLPFDALPAYLRSVSLLRPQGDVVAEVVHAVQALAQRRRRRRWQRAGAAGAAAVGLAAGLAWFAREDATAPAPDRRILDARLEKGEGDRWLLHARLRNDTPRQITTLRLDAEPEPGSQARFPSTLEHVELFPGQQLDTTLSMQLDGAPPARWRPCWTSVDTLELRNLARPELIEQLVQERGQRVCGDWRAWP
jgi:hypothetical protein